MIPTKNKKNLDTTIHEIRKFSFSYLEKYSPETGWSADPIKQELKEI